MSEGQTLREMLVDEIAVQLDQLKNLEPGSKERASATKDVTELYKTLTQELNGTADYEVSMAKIQAEQDIKQQDLDLEREKFEAEQTAKAKEAKKEMITTAVDWGLRALDLGVKVAAIVIPLKFYRVWFEQGLEFEKTGTFTSGVFKGLQSKVKPDKIG